MTTPDTARRGRRGRLGPALIGVAVSLALLAWAVRHVQFAEVVARLRAADPLLLAAAVAIATLTFVIRCIRWRALLTADDGRPLPFAPRWHAVAIGFMANNLLPLRAGEVIRCYVISRIAPVRFSSALSSVAVERVFDGLTVVALLAAALFASHLPADVAVAGVSVRRVAASAGAVCLAGLLTAMVVVARPRWVEGIVGRLVRSPRLADRVVAVLEGLRSGLAALRSPGRLAAVVGWSLVLWLVNAASFYVAFRAFDIGVDYPGAVLVLCVLVFGIAVPSTPGFIGPFEAVIVAVLALYGVDSNRAFSYAIAYHLTTFVPITLLGLASLSRTSIGFGELRRSSSA